MWIDGFYLSENTGQIEKSVNESEADKKGSCLS